MRGLFKQSLVAATLFLWGYSASAATLYFDNTYFSNTPTFSNVVTYDYTIVLRDAITAGTTYNNPDIVYIDYRVFGTLDTTPSGFPAFNLERTMTGSEFYAQGSSFSFSVDAAADLSDGLQLSDLSGTGTVFTYNGREVGTGRYHPSLLELDDDGTGLLQNSNNTGGVNPGSGEVVDVDFGEEYITILGFTPSSLTLAGADALGAVTPEPSTSLLVLLGFCLLRRKIKFS